MPRIGIGKGLGTRNSDESLSSYWITRSEFWSDGSIIDGKLLNLKNDQTKTPSLVDSYCLVMAVNDTITFTSLAGWSIVSHGGTSVIIIEGNTIKCTTEGTLFNMILSDGSVNHIYPLAEGGYTIAFDTADVPSHGTIVCASLVWSTQSTYHKNIEGINTRTGIDIVRQSTWIDSGTGVPIGWADTYAKGGNTTVDNIVRKTKTAGMTSYYMNSLFKTGILTVGKSYRCTARLRADGARNIHMRFGTGGAAQAQYVTTDWVTYTSATKVADGTQFGLINQTNDGWFEFDYVLIEEVVASHYVPKRQNSNLDAQGLVITTLGNGYFIECETKLLFPDLAIYQTIDDHFEFFYDKENVQLKLSYADLVDNPYHMERVFCQKTDGRLTRMIVVDYHNYTRTQFINFLAYIGVNSYVYTKITKGVFLWYTYDGNHAYVEGTDITAILNAKGVSVVTNIGEDSPTGWTGSNILAVLAWVANGNYLLGRLHSYYGAMSFEFMVDEEDYFAAEIASGDLTAIDAPAGARGAIVKNTWPDFVTEGTLMNVVKTSGTVLIGDAALSGYASVFWIPAGSSGVPAVFCEKPMYRDLGGGTGKMYYYQWAADTFFSSTFTNSDNIDVYVLTYTHYDFFSQIGMTCVFKHIRRVFESVSLKYRISGWLESHGMMTSGDITCEPIRDAGLKFGSNGQSLYTHSVEIFNNQDTPRNWAGYFGHHYFLNHGATDLASVLALIETFAAKNVIADTEFETDWHVSDTVANFQAVLDKCDEQGMLFLSAMDLIKNMQFNDYDGDDFWLP